MLKPIFLTFTLIITVSILVKAQSVKLSREDALTKAKENNLSLKLAELSSAKALNSYRMTNSVFLPKLTVSHTAISTNNPLSSFGFLLKQETVSSSDFEPTSLNDPGEHHNFETQLKAEQPIFNADGIYQRKAAKNQLKAARLSQEQQQNLIQYLVNKTYDQILTSQKILKLSKQMLQSALEIKKIAQDNFTQGLSRKNTVLEADVLVSSRQLQIEQVQTELDTYTENLNKLIGEPAETILIFSDSLVTPSLALQFDSAELSFENRPDIRALNFRVKAFENSHKANLMSWIPRINAFGDYEWNDSQFAGTNASNYLVGIKLQWNLFSGFTQISSYRISTINLNYARYQQDDYRQESQLKINQTNRELLLNAKKIQTTKLAGQQAREALKIQKDRFKNGLENIGNLLQTESLANQKQLEYWLSVFAYRENLYRLQYLTGSQLNF